jgi:hypothetical protein
VSALEPVGIRFAFYGLTDEPDRGVASIHLAYQRAKAAELIDGHGRITAAFTDHCDVRRPWRHRPEAFRLLETAREADRSFDAIVAGSAAEVFHGAQHTLTLAVLAHYGVDLWLPETRGAVTLGSAEHELILDVACGPTISAYRGAMARLHQRLRDLPAPPP